MLFVRELSRVYDMLCYVAHRHYSKQLRLTINEIAVAQTRMNDAIIAALGRQIGASQPSSIAWQLHADIIYDDRIGMHSMVLPTNQ
jgi:hypothetical protein